MATTANGWPYVEPADHPVEYPNVSQTLASLLQSRFRDQKWQIQAGKVAGAAVSTGMVTVTYPTGFAAVPAVLITPAAAPTGVGSTQNQYAIVTEYSNSFTAFVVYCMNGAGTVLSNGTAVYFHWLAIAQYA